MDLQSKLEIELSFTFVIINTRARRHNIEHIVTTTIHLLLLFCFITRIVFRRNVGDTPLTVAYLNVFKTLL